MNSDRRASGRGAARAVAGHVARKRFGQHFLSDRSVLASIVEAIDPREGDAVLEIGPGLGVLTTQLLRRLPRLHAVEIDRDLCRRLRERFDDSRLELHEADALAFDVRTVLPQADSRCLRIVGNLPYNISSPLLISLLDARDRVRDQHFLLQKEVVERVVARPSTSDYGRLSVLMQAFYDTELLFEVGPAAFDPPPRVDSALLRMITRPEPLISDPVPLQSVLAAAFAQRRKMIRSTLIPWLEQQGVEASGLSGDWRAEQIDVARYCALAAALAKVRRAR